MLWLGFIGLSLASQSPPAFQLVGVYDASSVIAVSNKGEQEFLWRASKAMEESCGMAKAPDRMGKFEAETVANYMSPTLAIVLSDQSELKGISEEGELCEMGTEGCDQPAPRFPVSASDIQVGIGIDKLNFILQPMVEPRYLSINVNGFVDLPLADGSMSSDLPENNGQWDTSRYQKLIRTQLEIETCLEHKVGRGWLGNTSDRLRQAFLLDPPVNNLVDRKYFGGQTDPVPALIGPSEACIRSDAEAPFDATGSKGNDFMDLTPSDIWGASLRTCEKGIDEPGRPLGRIPTAIPLKLSDNGVRQARYKTPKWSGLNIDVTSNGSTESDVIIDVTYLGEKVPSLSNKSLFPEKGKMIDILAELPHSYPRVGGKDDPEKYVVLLVPNWQLVEGLKRLYSHECISDTGDSYCRCTVSKQGQALFEPLDFELGLKACEVPTSDACNAFKLRRNEAIEQMNARMLCVDLDNMSCNLDDQVLGTSPADVCLQNQNISKPMPSAAPGVHDAVGWILENPEHLFIQVDPLADRVNKLSGQSDSAVEAGEDKNTPNLAGVTAGGDLGVQDWGYTVGQLAGRGPIVLPQPERADWEVSSQAQRAKEHALFIVSTFILFGIFLTGLRRISDFWTRTPEERAYYWPGRQAKNDDPTPEGVDVEGAEAELPPVEGGE